MDRERLPWYHVTMILTLSGSGCCVKGANMVSSRRSLRSASIAVPKGHGNFFMEVATWKQG